MNTLKETSKVSLTPQSQIKKSFILLLKFAREVPNVACLELSKTLEAFTYSLDNIIRNTKQSIKKTKIPQSSPKLAPLDIFKESFEIFSNYLKYIESGRFAELREKEERNTHQVDYNEFYREFEFSTMGGDKKVIDFDFDLCDDDCNNGGNGNRDFSGYREESHRRYRSSK